MARTMTVDGTVNNTFKVAAQGFTAWGFGTLAAVVRVVNTTATHARSLMVIGTDTEDLVEFYVGATATFDVRFYNGSVNNDSVTLFDSNKWLLMAVTKATGTATPRAHVHDFGAGTWLHENMGSTAADAAGTGATQHGTYGDTSGVELDAFDGQYLCQAAWKSRTMTDSEVERLARGLWDIWSPDLLNEFPSGRDNLTRTTIDCSRNRMRQVVRGSQVTRGNVIGPPGFRLSALNRRR